MKEPGLRIDLNCDLGEGAGSDAAVLPFITSANVSCGAHAGTPDDMAKTLSRCAALKVVVGAHPGHPDPAHFGRRELPIPPRDVLEETVRQIVYLRQMAAAAGVAVRYVKPHGGLYHQANRDDVYADAVVAAAERAGLPVVGLPGSRLATRAAGRVPFVAEGFADRRYQPDGSLVPRDQPGAFVEDAVAAIVQVRDLMARGVRTVCVHGDNPMALAFVRAVRAELWRAGVAIEPFA